MPDPDRTSLVDTIIRHIVENRAWILVGWTFVMSLPALANLLREHKYQKIQAQPVIRQRMINGRDGEFTWLNLNHAQTDILGLKSKSKRSGEIWVGFTAGVSMETDEIVVCPIWLYASDSGVGHFIYECHIKRRGPGIAQYTGEGHMPLNFKQRTDFREYTILDRAGASVSARLNRHIRPLKISINPNNDEIEFYDQASGRDVYFNNDTSSVQDLLVFGQYPVAKSPYVIQPGLDISSVSEIDDNKRLIFFVRDVYGHALE